MRKKNSNERVQKGIKNFWNILYRKEERRCVRQTLRVDYYVRSVVQINTDWERRRTVSIRKSILTRWKTENYISDTKYRTLYCSNGLLSMEESLLPKIHKPDCALRVIVSSVGSPLYPLATYLHNIQYY